MFIFLVLQIYHICWKLHTFGDTTGGKLGSGAKEMADEGSVLGMPAKNRHALCVVLAVGELLDNVVHIFFFKNNKKDSNDVGQKKRKPLQTSVITSFIKFDFFSCHELITDMQPYTPHFVMISSRRGISFWKG